MLKKNNDDDFQGLPMSLESTQAEERSVIVPSRSNEKQVSNDEADFSVTDFLWQIWDTLRLISNYIKPLTSFAYWLLQIGGKHVALIFSLGLIAYPLSVMVNPWVAGILALGAVIVAIISALRTQNA